MTKPPPRLRPIGKGSSTASVIGIRPRAAISSKMEVKSPPHCPRVLPICNQGSNRLGANVGHR